MPPFINGDPALTGDAYKALRDSGHCRLVAVVDASYNIPRDAQVIDYLGDSSANALASIIELVPVEPDSDGTDIVCMAPDLGSDSGAARREFEEWIDDKYGVDYVQRLSENETEDTLGFYDIVNNGETLFIRTSDTLPYSCAYFVLGHSQVEPQE